MSSGSTSSASKKVKLSPVGGIIEEEEDLCSICLQPITDLTIIPSCSHEFCFDCLVHWTEQSRKCPLCSQNVGEHLIHRIRSRYDYQKYYLPPLRQQNEPPQPLTETNAHTFSRRRRHRELLWARLTREEREEADLLDRAIEFRRRVYDLDLYAKHVASNSHTRYKPYPPPAKFASSPDLISRTTQFLRRELRVWPNLDIEFLTSLIISLMKAIDIRSERAVKLLAEFLDMDGTYVDGARHRNAEHLAHEIYSYIRSPYTDLFAYDSIVQYDERGNEGENPNTTRRFNTTFRNNKRPRSRSRSPSLSASHGPRQRKSETNTLSGAGISYPPIDNELRSYMNQNVVNDPTSDAKGKGRANGNDEEDSSGSPPRTGTQHESPNPIEERQQPKPPPRVRNRSLRESINAHLNPRGGSIITPSRSSECRRESRPCDSEKPPLLARLSDSVLNASIPSIDARREVHIPSSCHSVSPPPSNNPSPCRQGISKSSKPNNYPAVVDDDNKKMGNAEPPLSFSETAEEPQLKSGLWESESRTRKQSDVQSIPTPPLPTPPPAFLKTGLHHLHVANSDSRETDPTVLPSDSCGQFTIASSPSLPYPRNKLLARLEEEKGKSTLSQAQLHSASSQSESSSGILLTDSNPDDDRDVPSPTTWAPSSVSIAERMNSERVEAKLRTRALLRVRLAAENSSQLRGQK